MRSMWWILFMFGCQPIEGGKPFEAVPPEVCECDCPVCPEDTEATEAQAEVDETAADPDATEDGGEGEVEPAGMEGDPFAAAIMGQPEPTEPPKESTEEAAAPEIPAWTPSVNQPDWGVRLVSVVPGGTPPQAVLGLADGTSQVVRAGDMLPNVGLVVIAIGKDRVQLAKVRPNGDHAVVESLQLSAMYPSTP